MHDAPFATMSSASRLAASSAVGPAAWSKYSAETQATLAAMRAMAESGNAEWRSLPPPRVPLAGDLRSREGEDLSRRLGDDRPAGSGAEPRRLHDRRRRR